MGKFELVLLMCSMVAQECAEPKTHIHLYQSHSDCAVAGYIRSLKEIQSLQKTDVDDLQTMAAFATLLTSSDYSNINYHIVTGTYGFQEGLYVPPNKLLELAFKNHWTDAHNNPTSAVTEVISRLKPAIELGGSIWIAAAAELVQRCCLCSSINHQRDKSFS